MEQVRISGREGLVTVEVEAKAITALPRWLDCRKILDAAIDEYARQRTENIGPLPLPEHAEAWRLYDGQEVMK